MLILLVGPPQPSEVNLAEPQQRAAPKAGGAAPPAGAAFSGNQPGPGEPGQAPWAPGTQPASSAPVDSTPLSESPPVGATASPRQPDRRIPSSGAHDSAQSRRAAGAKAEREPSREQVTADRDRPWSGLGTFGQVLVIGVILVSFWYVASQGRHPDPAASATPTPASQSPLGAPERQFVEPEMVSIKGGCFQMGSPGSEPGRYGDERQHRVCVEGFKIGKYELTQGEWGVLMGNNPSTHSGCGERCPVDNVSWDDAQAYIAKLNARTGKRYRLPTEAEWEYACRGGGTGERYCGGNNLDALAWHEKNSGGQTHPVGQKASNGLGLYDLSGNVLEWTCSTYDQKYGGAETRCEGENHAFVLRSGRGGSWNGVPGGARAAYRLRLTPGTRVNDQGFRLAQD